MQCGQKDLWTTDWPEGPSMPMCMAEDSVSNENFVKIWENDKNGQCVTAFAWSIFCLLHFPPLLTFLTLIHTLYCGIKMMEPFLLAATE